MSNKTTQTAVPKLRFPEFLEAEAWEESDLGSVCTMQAGKYIKASEIADENDGALYPCYGGNGLRGYTQGFNYSGHYPLIGRQGALCGNITFASGDFYATEHALVVTPKPKTNINWLFYKLSLLNLNKYATGQAQPGLSVDVLKRVPAVVPLDKKEQQKIADCLSSVDELIAHEGQKLEALQDHKKGLMQELFPAEGETLPKRRFPEFQNAPEWEEKEVGEIFKVTRGNVLSMTLVGNQQTDAKPYPVYSSQTKRNGLSGFYSEYLYGNAITWTTDGANAGDVNYRSGKFYCTNVCGVLLNDEGYANPCIAALINNVSKNHVSYVGNPKLMNGVMSKIRIPVPAIAEQKKIIELLSSLDEIVDNQLQKIEALKEHKTGLMQQLFPNPDDIEV